jgi:serine/threonine-protein kinase HipA
MGIEVPAVTTGRAGKTTYLLVQRYDGTNSNDRWRRLHQEDFCQTLGRPPSAKYEFNQTGIPGPTLRDMFDVVQQHLPATEIVRLLDIVVFNVLACNTDRRACQELLHHATWQRSRAGSHVRRDLQRGLGKRHQEFRIGGESRGENLEGSHWRRLARECGLNPKQVFERIGTLARLALRETKAAAAEVASMPAGRHESLDLALSAVERRARAMIARLGTTEERPEDVALAS